MSWFLYWKRKKTSLRRSSSRCRSSTVPRAATPSATLKFLSSLARLLECVIFRHLSFYALDFIVFFFVCTLVLILIRSQGYFRMFRQTEYARTARYSLEGFREYRSSSDACKWTSEKISNQLIFSSGNQNEKILETIVFDYFFFSNRNSNIVKNIAISRVEM